MNSATLPATSALEDANGSAPDAPVYWAATIEAAPESALLARVLQRLMVQCVVIDRLRYESDETRASVCIEVLFRADEEHARFLARRLETIVSVDRVTLCPARVSREVLRASRPPGGVNSAALVSRPSVVGAVALNGPCLLAPQARAVEGNRPYRKHISEL